MQTPSALHVVAVVLASTGMIFGGVSATADDGIVFCDEMACDGFACDAFAIEDTICTREKLLGDCCGLRSRLIDSGVTPFLYYDSIFAANVNGGIRTDKDYDGQIYAGVDFDLEKLIGWNGTTLKLSSVERHGGFISDSVGGIYDPICLFGGQVGYLYQLWLEKKFGETWAVKFGRVSADTDFANHPLYRYSLSTAINGPIRATLLEASITSFPFPVWGGRIQYTPNDRNRFQVGVSQVSDRMFDFTLHGLDFSIRDDDGASVLAQYDWNSSADADRPTHVALGMIHSFFEFDDYDGVGTTDYLLRLYAHLDVEVAHNWTAFGFATYSDQDQIALTPVQISGGINAKGIFPTRPDDHTVCFATYGELSDEYGDSIGEDVSSEMVFEWGHRFQLLPSAYIQPSIQYIRRPGGTGNIPDSTVLGFWTAAAF